MPFQFAFAFNPHISSLIYKILIFIRGMGSDDYE